MTVGDRAMSALGGLRVLVTRPEPRAEHFADKLRTLGAEPVLLPLIRLVPPEDPSPLDRALARIEQTDWVVLTSPAGVGFVAERLATLGRPVSALRAARLAAIGPATARQLQNRGLQPDHMPSRYVAEALADEFEEADVAGRSFLLPRADIARPDLAHRLRERGGEVTEVVAYRTERVPIPRGRIRQVLADGIDVVTFTSSSTVAAFCEAVEDAPALLAGVPVACIGPITANAARNYGLTVSVVAGEHTTDGLIRAIREEVTPHARNPTRG